MMSQTARIIDLAKHGKRPAVIAAMLGTTVGTVTVTLSKARRRGEDIPRSKGGRPPSSHAPEAASSTAPARNEGGDHEVVERNGTIVQSTGTGEGHEAAKPVDPVPVAARRAGWTPERVDLLRELVAQGTLSYSAISARIGGGLSRNACIGKALRIGLGSKPAATTGPTDFQRRVVEMAKEGVPPRIIAERVGTNNRSISVALSKARARGENIPYIFPPAPKPRNHNHGGGVGRNIKNGVGKAFAAPAQTLPPEPPKAPDCVPVTLLSRTDKQCAWPIGEPCGPDTLFCGSTDKADELDSYCGYHRKIAGGAQTRQEWTPERRAAFYRGRARNASAGPAP